MEQIWQVLAPELTKIAVGGAFGLILWFLRSRMDWATQKVIDALPEQLGKQLPLWIAQAEQLEHANGAQRKAWVLERLDSLLDHWTPPFWMRLLPWKKMALSIAGKLIDQAVEQVNQIVKRMELLDPWFEEQTAKAPQK